MATGDVPESVYRNTLDLNRFSNGTSKKLVKQYDRIINDTIDQLARIERMPRAKQPKYKADRLRSLLKQLDASLKGWSNKSAAQMVKELDGITRLQSEFAQLQLQKALPNVPAVSNAVVNPLNVTKGYAESVVNSNPIDINASLLSDDLQAKVKGIPQKFSLTSKQGSLVNLPNGQNLKQAFRGLAAKQGELFGRTVRDGLLTGEPTAQLARRLRDQLIFEDGKPFKPNQVTNLVRTSVQQVSNDAAQAVYENNQDLTKKYKWVATLDARTAPECRVLDQQVFKYGEGPTPPQHFGCRCRTVAELDYEGLGITPPKTPLGKRAAEGGSVPAGTSYGKWLKDQSASYKAKSLGKNKVKYFNALSKKYGPDQALKKLVREDGSSKTLKQLQKTYTKTPSKKLAAKPKIKPPSKALIAKEGKYMTAAEKAGTVKYTPLTAAQKKLIDQSVLETKFKKSVQDVVPEVATFGKLPKSEQSTIKFLDNLKLKTEAEQKYWKSAKAFNSKYIPKDQFKTITPKQLARRIEDDKIAKLQKKLNNKAKKALQPKKEIKRDLRKWNDPSFLDKRIAGESKTSAVRKRSGLGKKKSEDLMFKPKPEEVGLTTTKFKQTETIIGEWAGSDYMQLRGVQLDQAQAVGAQLNPAQIKHLKRYKEIRARTENVRNQWGRYADQMEDYISKAPKWKGKPQALLAGQKELDGTIFRGIGFQDKRVVESIVESYKRGDAGLTMESWTANRRIASGFSADTHSVMIKQVNKYGTSIEPWNGLGEKEILQPRGVRYKVLSAETKEWVEEGIEKSFTEITLEAY
jgi:SPP1 gp7 family putative phage head morphogenesis protein